MLNLLRDAFKPILLDDGQPSNNHRNYRDREVRTETRGRPGSHNSERRGPSNPERGGPSNPERGGPSNYERGSGRSISPFSIRANTPIVNPNQVPNRLPPIRNILGDIIPDYGRGLRDVPYTVPMQDRVPYTRVYNRDQQVYSYTQG